LTITTTDDQLSRFLEVRAPLVSRRLDTVAKLVKQGIHTYVFVGPLLPHFRYQPELLDDLFQAIAETGTREVYIEHINLSPYIKEQMWKTLNNESEQIKSIYTKAQTDEHRQILNEIIVELIEKYNLQIRFGGTIYHPEL
jgi:DNA repair photolyase